MAAAQLGADLLPAGGDGQGIGIVTGLAEQHDELIHPAEIGPLRIDAAAA